MCEGETCGRGVQDPGGLRGSLNWGRTGPQKMSGSSDGHFEFCQLTGIIEARSYLLVLEPREFSDNLLWIMASGEITENQANGDAGAFDTRSASQDIGIAFNVVFPCYVHFRPHFPTVKAETPNVGLPVRKSLQLNIVLSLCRTVAPRQAR
jgi:hypothetical protein